MDIIEAIKSGKRFRLKGWNDWIAPDDFIPFDLDSRGEAVMVLALDLASDNFEIEEEKIKLSAEQVKSALILAWDKFNPGDDVTFWDVVIKELGFKE